MLMEWDGLTGLDINAQDHSVVFNNRYVKIIGRRNRFERMAMIVLRAYATSQEYCYKCRR